MASSLIDTLLLLALPASGKSEVRRYLASMDARKCAQDFHMGPTVQLDDFPYVHMMRRTDEALIELGKKGVFFHAPDRPFADSRDWGTLIELVNEDYADLVGKKKIVRKDAGAWMLERLTAARAKVGAPSPLAGVDAAAQQAIAAKLDKEATELLAEKLANYPDSLNGKTLVIEFARGGPEGSSLPLRSPYGYQYSVARLSPAILERARILYIWVTPEESRRKNQARANPNDPGSILHHGVPEAVMRGEYGTDDMAHLLETSGRPGNIKIESHGKSWLIPCERFDNRVDKTSFIREDKAKWSPSDVAALHDGMAKALTALAKT
jgi:hypothetical protein